MTKSTRPSKKMRRSGCPIACALDILGDRWTLLIMRDLFSGKSRYREFEQSAEHIPTNILADRLQRLESAGLIESTPYQDNPPRYSYSMTKKGTDLKPVLAALAMWAMQHVPRTRASGTIRSALRS